MCVEREPDRDSQRDDEQALEEIRQLFARYRQVARHGIVTERIDVPEASPDDVEAAPALAAQ